MRRILPLLILAACGGYAPDTIGPDQLCVTAVDAEVCVDEPDVTVEGDVITISATAPVPGAELGYDTVDVEVRLMRTGDEVEVVEARVPVLVTCIVDFTHGDHCHLGVPSVRGGTLPLNTDDVRVTHTDSLDDGTLAVRFSGTSPVEVPGVCMNTCAETTRDATAEPMGPYRVDGAIRVPLP